MRSGLEYASAIWDPPHKSNARKKLESVQRKAARFVTGNPQKRHQDHLPDRDYDYVSVGGLIEDLEWPSLESRRKSARCTLVFKIKTGLVAVDPSLLPTPANKKTREAPGISAHALPHRSLRTSTQAVTIPPHCERLEQPSPPGQKGHCPGGLQGCHLSVTPSFRPSHVSNALPVQQTHCLTSWSESTKS